MKSLLTVLFCLCVPLMGADKKPLSKADLEKVTDLPLVVLTPFHSVF